MMRVRSVIASLVIVWSGGAHAQWVTTYEQAYWPGAFNWTFDTRYPDAGRLFHAFDYGHATLYETLLTRAGGDPAELEVRRFTFLVDTLLRHPPRLPLDERPIEPEYAKLAPEVKAMFDWAHLLHRQIYDVLSDTRLSSGEQSARISALVRYYRSRRDLAFSTHPKAMTLMEGQAYSQVFRKRYPKFNGLIWAYHWLQIGLYDALLAGASDAERAANVHSATARFWAMLEAPPSHLPAMMPMAPAVAPRFTARFPDAAAIFDNLHAMHDVISDLLADSAVPRAAKRGAILQAAGRYRDDTSFVLTRAQWEAAAHEMDVEHMGGTAIP